MSFEIPIVLGTGAIMPTTISEWSPAFTIYSPSDITLAVGIMTALDTNITFSIPFGMLAYITNNDQLSALGINVSSKVVSMDDTTSLIIYLTNTSINSINILTEDPICNISFHLQVLPLVLITPPP